MYRRLGFILLAIVLLFGCTRRELVDPNKKILNSPLDDLKTLDPAVAYDVVSVAVLTLNQESLFQYAYLKTPIELEPLLADGMAKFSVDKRTVTIKIKKGVRWQDDPAFPGGKGRELVADDFLYGWKRLLIPELQSQGTWIFEDKVVGYSELKHAINTDKSKTIAQHLETEIDGFKVIDPHTIQIKLKQPYPQLLHVLAMPFGAPVAKEVVEKYGQQGLNDRMVGTGPYMLRQFVRGSRIELVKNPNFRGETYPSAGDEAAKAGGLLADAGKQLPFLDGINFTIFKESQPAWLQFMRGSLDTSAIPKDSYDSAVKNGVLVPELAAKGIELQKMEDPTIWFLCFNMKDKLLGKNADLRRAMARAINRDELIQLFLNGRGIKAMSMVPPMIPGHTDRKELEGDFNLDEAKKYLAKAGFPDGKGLPVIKFDLRGPSSTARQQAEYIKNSLAKIGVNLEIVVNTFPAYLDKEKNGNLQFFLGGWVADYPDAENFMQLMWSKNANGGTNVANWVNNQYDQLYQRIAAMTPSAARTDLIRRAEDLVFKDGVWSMLFYPEIYALQQGWVKNYRPSPIIINKLKYLDLDLEQKKELLKKF